MWGSEMVVVGVLAVGILDGREAGWEDGECSFLVTTFSGVMEGLGSWEP